MASKVKSKWDALDTRVQKIAKLLTGIAAIIGVLAAGTGWLLGQIDTAISKKIEAQTTTLQQEVKQIASDREATAKQTELQLTRLELLLLMETDPDNVVEIEKVAHRYFRVLGGNAYLSSEYSRWCKAYSADCEIIFK